jgi:hypothetical protein
VDEVTKKEVRATLVRDKQLPDTSFKALMGMSAVEKKLLPLLEQRIAALEAQPRIRYVGTWRESELYAEANLVTDRGGLWLARTATYRRPGDNDDWQLIVKSGRRATHHAVAEVERC